ncbi:MULTISPECIES: RES family NAD+ phosphorylase [unclassified Providencia]|uniref:RES family NAD+ phosphorylase n=1 Tax=unclassified Providencia TaxID=2633465 RepID=UPI0023495CB4|nr:MULTISPECIES: RES family NAD+ phosphorylase [unclassified Providencia]
MSKLSKLMDLSDIDLDDKNENNEFICKYCINDREMKKYKRKLHHQRICNVCKKDINYGYSFTYLIEKLNRKIKLFYIKTVHKDGLKIIQILHDIIGDYNVSLILHDRIIKESNGGLCENSLYIHVSEEISTESAQKHHDSLIENLTYGNRFFNKELEDYYNNLISASLSYCNIKNNNDCLPITIIKKGTKLYRARIIHSDSDTKKYKENPDCYLGPAPYDKAKSNRMSPEGIPMLYLSNDRSTCISELRPSIGDKIATVEFLAKKDLIFFDFNKITNEFKNYKNINNNSLLEYKNEKLYIIKKIIPLIENQICQPAKKNNDYLSSQALTEAIKNHYVGFDGAIFKSVQNDKGINYVIFNKIPFNKGVNLSSSDFHVEFHCNSLKFIVIKKIKYEY